ncbi:glycosyltransferase [Fibrobacter succinogenes]|uniref:Glycosyl transferases group 1 n=1 Tax=Fibrobacter succinogenes TaxID=833 RepID=A0A380RUP2_FIBSU|nr:glycosyltransferase [Fibrobacter succinogenes]PWJ37010.1 glycosyl transferase family 1 [Fibrobacter succinogenes subsp. elongatus]SUQ19258.1 Glycosyl transferases group 1 [Fibrobacter succinogenes]
MNVVIINAFDTYEHRVKLLYDVFKENGFSVKVLTSNFRHFEKIKRTEKIEGFHFFDAEPYKKNLSYQRLHSHYKLSKNIFKSLENEPEIDILWVLVPPNSFVKDAASYKKAHPKVKLIFDLIDLWPETMPIGFMKKLFPFSVWKNLRNKNLKYADTIVTECNLYQETLKDVLHNLKVETLYLARPLVPYEPHLSLPQDKVNLCYLGSINNIIDIDVIANIVSEFTKFKPVTLHIVGDGEKKDQLINAVEGKGGSVVFHGKVYDKIEKQKIFDSCHYGLNIMKSTVCVGLTMKSMDYLEYGLPMINNIKGDTWDIIERKQIGLNINSLSCATGTYNVALRTNARCFFENNLTKESFDKKVEDVIARS